MTIYEKNIQTLSRYYPEMDYNIDKAKHELKENYTIIEEKSNDGLPVLKVKRMVIAVILEENAMHRNHQKSGWKHKGIYVMDIRI